VIKAVEGVREVEVTADGRTIFPVT
jgi:hypothetical protein